MNKDERLKSLQEQYDKHVNLIGQFTLLNYINQNAIDKALQEVGGPGGMGDQINDLMEGFQVELSDIKKQIEEELSNQ